MANDTPVGAWRADRTPARGLLLASLWLGGVAVGWGLFRGGEPSYGSAAFTAPALMAAPMHIVAMATPHEAAWPGWRRLLYALVGWWLATFGGGCLGGVLGAALWIPGAALGGALIQFAFLTTSMKQSRIFWSTSANGGKAPLSVHTAASTGVITGIVVVATFLMVREPVNDVPPDSDRLARAIGSEAALNARDWKVFREFSRKSTAWNSLAAPLVQEYQDPATSGDAWVAANGPRIDGLAAVVSDMRGASRMAENPQLKQMLSRMSDSYGEKLSALRALRTAIARGDPESEEQAVRALSRANEDAAALSREWIGAVLAAYPEMREEFEGQLSTTPPQ